jgi:hypothetical protein
MPHEMPADEESGDDVTAAEDADQAPIPDAAGMEAHVPAPVPVAAAGLT